MEMEQRTRRTLANRLMAYCRKYSADGEREGIARYEFQRRMTRDDNGAGCEQILFADGFVLLDVTALASALPNALTDGHWHTGIDAYGDFRAIDLARAWDTWSAMEPDDTLDALNLYAYYNDALCQWFSVIGSQDDGNHYARRALINTEFLRLMTPERIEPYDEFIFTIATDGRVRVVDDASGVTLGYVMPIADGMKNAGNHYGQLKACHTCGGDGDWRGIAVRVDENETVIA